MHYPLTDIQANFEINRSVRYRNTVKRNYFHRRQTSRTTTIGSFFEKKKNTKNDMVSQMACAKKLGEPFMAHLEIRHYTVHYLSAKLSYKLPSERSPVSA